LAQVVLTFCALVALTCLEQSIVELNTTDQLTLAMLLHVADYAKFAFAMHEYVQELLVRLMYLKLLQEFCPN
jgi:hypothetical protein